MFNTSRSALAALLAASLVAASAAAFTPPAATPPPITLPGEAPPMAIPVPSDLPVVKKQELESGLVIEDLKIGEGYEVKPGGAVVAHYHGTLKDGGAEFDSSFRRGEPVAFPLSNVIQGWQDGVPGMKVGGIRRLVIPAKLAYGEQARDEIPANSDLVFVIQLVDALQVEDIEVGDGEEVGPRPVCVTAFKAMDKDGKEIEAAGRDKPFIWVPGEHMGVSMGLEGMKVGGKRKLTIPKEMNQSAMGAPTHGSPDQPLVMELELIAVKNLVPPRPKN